MDNLVFSCTDALDQPSTPACGVEYGERVVKVMFMKEGGSFTVASDVPTAAEFETAVTSGEISVLDGITNGHRVEQGATELSGDDTESGGTERYDVVYRIEGRIKRVDETVSRATEKLSRYSVLRTWYITEKNYCFGGATGYAASPNFDLLVKEGKGTPPYIPFFCDFTAIGADYASFDADYDDIAN